MAVVEKNPTDLILVMADMARANPPLSGAFLSEITRHLQGQSAHFAFANSWLAQRLSEQGLTIELLVQTDGQEQAADQVSMGNSINSLRFLSSNDWRDFVERHSLVERILREDRVYGSMDFATRDRYRHVVEEVARRSPCTEQDVARKAIQLAETHGIGHTPLAVSPKGSRSAPLTMHDGTRRAPATMHDGLQHAPVTVHDGARSLPAVLADESEDGRTSHVGYFLIDRGRGALERSAASRLPAWTSVSRMVGRFPLFAYLFGVLAITVIATSAFMTWLMSWEVGTFALCMLVIPFAMCAAHLGVGVVNWLAVLLVQPRPLPRLDFSAGIPPEHRTVVVVPTMLSSAAAVANLLDGLEERYLANRDNHLHFALLTDLLDAPQEVMPEDAELVRLAKDGIEHLNQKYENQRSNIFYFFHRPRRWNAQEGAWMGFERKRGKLAEFNALLRDSSRHTPFAVEEDGTRSVPAALAEVRYVITLDTDTQLPRDAARQMIGAMAHPLNRPVFDAERCRVVAGYGILQPRVGVSLPSAQRSWFVRFFAGEAGVDPYTRVVSDLYQDLFGEGSFVGKGIYDVDAFEQCCRSFPENTILSHDLLESTYARSALLSDVELYEEFPSRYLADVSRRQRWIRGDWQIAWWLLPRVPALIKDEGGKTNDEPDPLNREATFILRPSSFVRNPIGALSCWKIFDNLRRSLVPVAMLLLLVLSWLLLGPLLAASASIFVLAVVGGVPLLAALKDVLRKPAGLPLLTHLHGTTDGIGKQLAQFLCAFVFLPYEAFISADAISRTITRMLWTKTKMLEWRTSSDVGQGASISVAGYFGTMWFGPAMALTAALLLILGEPIVLLVAGPLLGLWLVSPLVAWWLSRTLPAPAVSASRLRKRFSCKS